MPNNPVQIILNDRDFHQAPDPGRPPRNKDFFEGADKAFVTHKDWLLAEIDRIIDEIRTSPYGPAVSTAVQYPATRRSKIRPRGGDRRHGARAYQIAGACHGALAPWAKTAPSDFRTFVAAFGQCCWRDDNSRRSSRGC